MSEPLAERLSRFTPDGSGLDRDALLFAAGRASARPNRRWAALAAALAASQVLTLVSLWPRANTPATAPPAASFALPGPSDTSPPPRDPSELAALSARLLATEGDWPPPADEGPMIDPEPPLRVYDAPPAKYLN
jgi:hypothetical protein